MVQEEGRKQKKKNQERAGVGLAVQQRGPRCQTTVQKKRPGRKKTAPRVRDAEKPWQDGSVVH
jgi:hypothetical protein